MLLARLPFIVAATSALVSAGCGGDDCTADIAPSLRVEVTDAAGAAVPGVVLEYSINAGRKMREGCPSTPSTPCSVWELGTEEAGVFDVTATAPDGRSHTASVLVLGKECHVATEELQITLK